MNDVSWTIRGLREALAAETVRPTDLAEKALAHSNGNRSHNTYLWQDPAWTQAEAIRAGAMARGDGGAFGDGRDVLWGLPISLKDCFDLAGAPTSCGVRSYRDHNGSAARDSWLAEQLRAAGAVIIGKTNMHPLAYGITGENPDFGDCLQPGDEGALTGGSSSGAAASVLEGSAVAALGTDTGGSIRAPAALCGLAGYRASLGRGDWRGGAHLAQSFDTMGWLFRDLEDAPLLAGFFAPPDAAPARAFTRFAIPDASFFYDCEPEVIFSFRAVISELQDLGLHTTKIDVKWWDDAFEIYAPIQAWEAARVHEGNFGLFEPALRERLEWGARITPMEISELRERRRVFAARMDDVFATQDLLLMPASPVARLAAGADHSQTRARILRYTTPISLAGVPVVTLPCIVGGMQLAAARGCDESLVALAAKLGAKRKSALFASIR
ncbi:MAG: amidase [Terracidiphilus sp.]|jgi:aspartyl-tRNA(Asn)/glutamyl-tRNA(Gln) amidotransferase subunit A